jgi:hypothetical protein
MDNNFEARLGTLKGEAIAKIMEFEELAKHQPKDWTGTFRDDYNLLAIREYDNKFRVAAAESCAYQEAYAIMAGISYDEAAELLHTLARGGRENGLPQND